MLLRDAEGNAVAVPVVAARTPAWAAWRALPRPQRLRVGGWVGCAALLTLLFVQPLAKLVTHALQYELYSHIPLVPAIAGYLLYVKPRRVTTYRSSIIGTVMLGAVGFAALTAAFALRGSLSVNDHLAVMTLAYVSFLASGGFLFLGSAWMAAAAFPVAFLVFMVPLPDAAVHWVETASVAASADVAVLFFQITGTPLLREGMLLALPGIVLEVGRECSGIRSSWVLFITSLLASHLFLQSPWRRFVLVAFVIPLGIVRNGFRILVIGLLCVQVGPHMIDSVIHRRGGPLFFVLSLVPLFGLLWWLRRREQRVTVAG